MKTTKLSIILFVSSLLIFTITLAIISFYFYPQLAQQDDNEQEISADTCIADDCLLIEGLEYPVGELSDEVQYALREAIYDEYKARGTYELIISKFGSVRPFSMIIRSEEQHIASLKAIYDKYGIKPPDDPQNGIPSPDSITEACELGVQAEIANVALYKDELLPIVSEYPDITQVFNTLMNASEDKHLPAFSKCAD